MFVRPLFALREAGLSHIKGLRERWRLRGDKDSPTREQCYFVVTFNHGHATPRNGSRRDKPSDRTF